MISGNKVRKWAYDHAVVISALVAIIVVIGTHLITPISASLSDKPSLVTISVTLAGFLFTGQGIMLALPVNTKFMQLVKEYGYLDDFHKLCRWAEMAFIGSVVFSLELVTNLFADQVLANILYLISFLWPLILSIWALHIFSHIISASHQ